MEPRGLLLKFQIRTEQLPQVKRDLRNFALAFLALCLALGLTSLAGATSSVSANASTQPQQLHDVSFSHDGRRLLFTRCGGKLGVCAIHEFDLTSGALRYYSSPKNEAWGHARYSPQGNWIVFTATPLSGDSRVLEATQLVIMRPDGSEVRRLTNSEGWKVAPSFSLSGKKIIFVRAGTIRKSGKTHAADYDIYSFDIGTARETRLTDFQFFQISRPFYFGDDQHFVFSAEYPRRFPNLATVDQAEVARLREQLEREYKGDQIYLMTKGDTVLKPWIRLNDYSNRPLVSFRSGKIFFQAIARTAEGRPEGVFFHQYEANGAHRRIGARIGGGTIWSSDVSPDGKRIVLIYSPAAGIQFGRSVETRKLILIDTDAATTDDVELPFEASCINCRS